MKIAVPVEGDTLKMVGNAGHTPYFAIYNLKGGMFRSFEFEGLRANPKMEGEEDHHDHDDHHTCEHDENDMEHVKAHDTMADAISDCDYIVVKMACKNTANSMNNLGVKLKKYNGTEAQAGKILMELAAQFS
jgi:predicted Fe-Mo cluster-binding NifX family protein